MLIVFAGENSNFTMLTFYSFALLTWYDFAKNKHNYTETLANQCFFENSSYKPLKGGISWEM